MNLYIQTLRKFSDFSSRASLKEYWTFTLLNIFFVFALIFIGSFAKLLNNINIGSVTMIISFAFTFILFIPSLAVTVRRLHDTNKSGMTIFVVLTPFVGAIWLLVLLCQDGTKGDNNYGSEPTKETPQRNSQKNEDKKRGDSDGKKDDDSFIKYY